MRRLYNNVDRAAWLAALLKWFRVNLPFKRGLLVLGAMGLTILSFIVHLIWLATGNALVGLCGFTLLHAAILIGFLGVLLAEVLGRGYRE
jgi:hypothetical protein